MTKLIIASNRIPVTIKFNGDEFELVKSQGGLATGLASLMSEDNTLWVGWHGSERSLNQPEDLKLIQTLRDQKFEVLDLSRDEFELFYNSVSNAILWPVYHSLVDKLQLKLEGWDVYELVNRRFADRIISLYNEGDFVWIHDYHLQLVPHMIRAQIPDAKIGFFLHIPFPSPDIFRVLPWRDEVLTGLLGADIIGFHTYSYCHHFQSTLLHILGVESYADTIQYSGRVIKFGAFPLGVDPERIQTLSETLSNGKLNEISGAIQQLKGDHPSNINAKPVSIVLSVDRMDYTKGIPRRMLAFERLLEKNPDLCGSIILIQIAAPSRDKVTAYEQYRDSVEGHVGRINGRFGTIGYHPIHYVGKSFTQEELFQIYKRVDVMLVTPLRDGMNLVAKEFIATRRDNDGVLVLSEFAGAAEELGEAVLVNPYDLDNTAEGILLALQMTPEERHERMKLLRQRVSQFDASTWAKRFMDFLHLSTEKTKNMPFSSPVQLSNRVLEYNKIVLFLDYDGTLFPIVRIPQLAKPDAPLQNLLNFLANHPRVEVHIVTGRPKEIIDQWFPVSRVHFHAEHGATSRVAEGSEWMNRPSHLDKEKWYPFVRSVLEEYSKNTPGSFIEEKDYSMVWHYRMSDPIQGETMAKMLRVIGRESFAPIGLEVIPGKKAIEIRERGIHKGLIVSRISSEITGPFLPIAIGDDVTDEDMFGAMGDNGLTIVVGEHDSKARHRLKGPVDVRLFLELIAQSLFTPNI